MNWKDRPLYNERGVTKREEMEVSNLSCAMSQRFWVVAERTRVLVSDEPPPEP